ncbi:hypothetical protein [Rhizohabitans arisaemae]|nr:hypothetical protein [Rhizohabitans arisaemae]
MNDIEDPEGSEDFTLNVRLVDNAPELATVPSADCTSDGCTTTMSVYPC